MAPRLYDQKGQIVELGRELGKGGEGSVFEIPSQPNSVAKLYHESISSEKADKLRFMAQSSNQRIGAFAAWPSSVLSERPNSDVAGIMMPRISGGKEIHLLYGPAHRKQYFPNADWRFLIRTARNAAAAFSALHNEGIVIGDVNQGNLLVSPNAMVTFIDCDSFQFSVAGRVFRCGVGVPHFTPPELQSINLGSVDRNPNHDSFGLAILLFHLLFMGRHPFAGKYLGAGDMPIEKAIQEGRFAYGSTDRAKQMLPPPNTVPMHAIPPEVGRMFEQAFTSRQSRPTAAAWATALESLESQVIRCKRDGGHWHHRISTACPWCDIFVKGGPNFFISVSVQLSQRQRGRFDIVKVWAQIEKIKEPGKPPTAKYTRAGSGFSYRIPDDAESSLWTQRFLKRMFTGCSLGVFLAFISPVFLAFPVLGVGFFLTWFLIERRRCGATKYLLAMKKQRTDALNEREMAESHVSHVVAHFRGQFQTLRAQLHTARDHLNALPSLLKNQLLNMQGQAIERQLQVFLESKFIDKANISGIGPSRLAILESYGIETAWDLTPSTIQLIPDMPSFGPKMAANLHHWRLVQERMFHFDPAKDNRDQLKQSIELKFAQQMHAAQTRLTLGIEELQKINTSCQVELAKVMPMLQDLRTKESEFDEKISAISAAIRTRTSIF